MKRKQAATKPIEDVFWTRPETAKYIGVECQTMAKWAMREEGPPFTRVGRSIRYRRSLVEEWLESRTVQTIR